jgi:hypothetical protein
VALPCLVRTQQPSQSTTSRTLKVKEQIIRTIDTHRSIDRRHCGVEGERPAVTVRDSLPTWLKLVRTFGDRGDGCAEVVGEWLGGGDGVVAGLDFDGAVRASRLTDQPVRSSIQRRDTVPAVPRTA